MAMPTAEEHGSQTDKEFHRKVAAECFNRTWDFLEQKNRSLDDDQMMLNLAHASRYHWSLIWEALELHNWRLANIASLRCTKPTGSRTKLCKESA